MRKTWKQNIFNFYLNKRLLYTIISTFILHRNILSCFSLKRVGPLVSQRSLRYTYGLDQPDGCWWVSTLGALSMPPRRDTRSTSCGCSSQARSPMRQPARTCGPVSLLPAAPEEDIRDARAGGTRRGRYFSRRYVSSPNSSSSSRIPLVMIAGRKPSRKLRMKSGDSP